MKKSFYYILCAILLTAVLALTSCGKEDFQQEVTIEDATNEQTLEATSAIINLMQRTADNDGSFDNIVDGSSCFDISFPYLVSVNGVELTIASMEDLELIEKIFDAFETDEDILDIIFPITITLADYTELTLNGVSDLQELADQCTEGEDDDIECIDFVYPITVFTFDPNLVRTATVTANSDSELRRFFTGLGATDLISIEFPLSFELQDGTTVTVNSNTELGNAIETAIDSCDEDDDNDFNDDDFTQEGLNAVLVECPWLVKGLERNNQDFSQEYVDYVLNFTDDGSVTARNRDGELINGEWSTSISDFRVLLRLEFEFLADFTLEWFVNDIDEEKIKLFVGDSDKIIMIKYCEDVPVACGEEFISAALDSCRWLPSQQGFDFLNDLSIDFSNRNIHVYDEDGVAVDEGNWEISGNVVTFNNLSMELANYIGVWEVVACSAVRFELQRGEETLVIEKECEKEPVECSEAFIRETISSCQWAPSQGENSFLDDLLIDFSRMAIHVRDPEGTVVEEGNWSISGNVLTFNQLSMALANYIGEWTVTECSAERFVLERDGDNEPLVIEKVCE